MTATVAGREVVLAVGTDGSTSYLYADDKSTWKEGCTHADEDTFASTVSGEDEKGTVSACKTCNSKLSFEGDADPSVLQRLFGPLVSPSNKGPEGTAL
jgi:hypothetical protein